MIPRTRQRASRSSALLVLIAGMMAPAPAPAQDPSLDGSYRLVPDRSDRVDEAVEAATDGAGFFVRTVGRRLLAGKLAPPEQLRIVVTDSAVVIGGPEDAARARLADVGPVDGVQSPRGENDRPAAVAWWEAAVLRVRFAEDEGARDYRYSLDPEDGTLRVRVTVTGGKLPRPVELSLT